MLKLISFLVFFQLLSTSPVYAKQTKKKETFPKEYYTFRTSVLETIESLILEGFKEAKIKNPESYGVKAANFSRKIKPIKKHHRQINLMQNSAAITTFISRMTYKDFKTKNLAGIYDNKTLFWIDRNYRQHAASFEINWWFGEEPTFGEHYTNLILKKLWIEHAPSNKKEYYPTKSSRQLTYTEKKPTPQKDKSKK